jgi:hypothetical protein
MTDTGSGHHRPPRDCPVCGERLLLTRLGCRACGTELSGRFEACEFCGLTTDERDVLAVFLASRGNMKELERHLGVSYPTARARFDSLLARLGLTPPPPVAPPASAAGRLEILEALARGNLDVDQAQGLLAELGAG